jgi:mono/diheme cytochrome c family protein
MPRLRQRPLRNEVTEGEAAMDVRPLDPLTRTSRLPGAGALALSVLATVFLAACQPSAEANIESGAASSPGPAPADTPVVGNSSGGDATGEEEGAPAARQGGAQAGQAGGDVYDGWKMYAVHCERCHGQDALGSALAPDLRKSAGQLGHDGFVQVVVNGRSGKGMPAFKGVLEPPQIENVFAYVQARASGALGPGRPQR